jgi:hypothetical protein
MVRLKLELLEEIMKILAYPQDKDVLQVRDEDHGFASV